jgi:hypothetical protein
MLELQLGDGTLEFHGGALKFASAGGVRLTYTPFTGACRNTVSSTVWTAEWEGVTGGASTAQGALDNLVYALRDNGIALP